MAADAHGRAEAPPGVGQTLSTLTCPECGGVSTEAMPTDACQFFYDCRHCGGLLRPLPGDCCVFCSYADTPCPPIQEVRSGLRAEGCCSPAGGGPGDASFTER